MTSLTPKERVKMAVSHVQPDRPPIQTYLTPEMHQALTTYFAGASIDDVFQVDLRCVWPTGSPASKFSGDSQFYDEFGTGYTSIRNDAGGVYMEATDRTLERITTMEQVRAHPWPSADEFDYSGIPDMIESVKDYAVAVGSAGMPDIINGVGRGRGMEQVLVDIATQDEVGVAIIDARVNYFYDWCKDASRLEVERSISSNWGKTWAARTVRQIARRVSILSSDPGWNGSSSSPMTMARWS